MEKINFLKYLIKKGIDLNLKDDKGKTALIHAIEKWQPIYSDIIKLLVNHEITEDIIKHDYRTRDISKFKNEEKKKKYIKLVEIYHDRWSWHYKRYKSLILLLKRNNIDISKIEKDKRKEVIINVYNLERDKLFKLLLDNGSDINLSDNMGRSPLIYAIEKKYDLDFIKYLINNGADINAKETGKYKISDYMDSVNPLKNDGKTPLIYAVLTNNFEIIKYLVDSGANVKMKDNTKKSPLMYSIEFSSLNIVKYLIESGSDLKIRDKYNQNLLYIAKSKKKILDRKEKIKLIREEMTKIGIYEDNSNRFFNSEDISFSKEKIYKNSTFNVKIVFHNLFEQYTHKWKNSPNYFSIYVYSNNPKKNGKQIVKKKILRKKDITSDKSVVNFNDFSTNKIGTNEIYVTIEVICPLPFSTEKYPPYKLFSYIIIKNKKLIIHDLEENKTNSVILKNK
jgi:ankyrin repeat protein